MPLRRDTRVFISAVSKELGTVRKLVVKLREEKPGVVDPNIAAAINTVATLLWVDNPLEEAQRRSLLNSLYPLLQGTNALQRTELFLRRALAIDEQSYGPEHPNVAIRLDHLVLLLQTTNRLQEAEPLSRRSLEIFLDVTRRTGHEHPNLQQAMRNYAAILKGVGRKRGGD